MNEAFLVQVSPNEGSRYPARLGAIIGREGCEILIRDPEVSRRHAAIRSIEGGIGIEDLGSRNGTLVNDEPIDGVCLLSDGDQLRVGDAVLRFETTGGTGTPRGGDQEAARGDVPAPEIVPSAVRRLPPPETSVPPVFAPATQRRIRGTTARRVEATIVSYAVVLATAVAVVAYFATR